MPSGPGYQSRWSSATLSTAADSAAIERGPVQLEAGELDGQDVVRLGVHHRLDDRQADVAARDRAQACRPQHRLEHLHRRGLAVGAGHGQPGCRVLAGRAAARPARPRPRSGPRARRACASSGAAGDQPGEVTTRSTSSGSSRGGARPEADRGAQDLEQGGLLAPVAGLGLVERGHRRAEEGEVVGGGEPGDAEARHDDADAAPVAACGRERRGSVIRRRPTRRRRPRARRRRRSPRSARTGSPR